MASSLVSASVFTDSTAGSSGTKSHSFNATGATLLVGQIYAVRYDGTSNNPTIDFNGTTCTYLRNVGATATGYGESSAATSPVNGHRTRSFYLFSPDSGTYNLNLGFGSTLYESYAVAVAAFSGVDTTFDTDDFGSTSSGTTTGGISITTTNADCILVGIGGYRYASNPSITPPSGYTTHASGTSGTSSTNDCGAFIMSKDVSSATTYTDEATLGSATGILASLNAFKLTAGGGGGGGGGGVIDSSVF